MRRTTRCALVAGLLALLLGPLFLIVAKGPIDRALAAEATGRLAPAGLDGIEVDSDWTDITLRGPASAEAAALAAVEQMEHRDAARSVRYVATGPAAASGSVDVDVALDPGSPGRVTLTGRVADEQQRSNLVQAASAAYGAGNVVDRLTVSGASPDPSVVSAVDRLGSLLAAFGPSGVTGSLRLQDTALTVDASAPQGQAVADANAALDRAAGAGLRVDGEVAAAVAPPSSTASPSPAASPSPSPSPSPSRPAASPSPSGTAAAQDALTAIALKGIRFQTGSAALTPQGRATLDQAVAVLKRYPTVKVEVSGHTDDVGNPATNTALSLSRAKAVRAYFIGKGIAADRLLARGYGQTRPVATNATEAGRQANRRIDLTIVGS